MPWKVAAGVTCICHLVSAIASMLQLQPAVHVCVLYTPAMLVGHMNRVMVIAKDLTVDIGRARAYKISCDSDKDTQSYGFWVSCGSCVHLMVLAIPLQSLRWPKLFVSVMLLVIEFFAAVFVVLVLSLLRFSISAGTRSTNWSASTARDRGPCESWSAMELT